jgi:rare lipoprotein A
MKRLAILCLLSYLLASTASSKSVAMTNTASAEQGIASWYGPGWDGKETYSGETFNMYAMTVASPHLPMGVWVRITNLENGRSVIARVNDRGPSPKTGRILDASLGVAVVLRFKAEGLAEVLVEVLPARQQENHKPPAAKPIKQKEGTEHEEAGY